MRLLASGVSVPWALRARDLLAEQWGVGAEVWSVTSWGELRRDGVECERHNLRAPGRAAAGALRPAGPGRIGQRGDRGFGLDARAARPDPAVGAGPVHPLGTDGFGLSDTRPAVRRHFNVDAESITVAALAALVARGEIDRAAVTEAAAKYRIDDPQAAGPQTSDPGVA